jgi:selenocysteine-specific elongation factor
VNEALTLGVVGHVDHGKTALIRALTGIETDRLKEERERGLSIVLGFSYLELESGVVDLIDVPGHEDFIRAMISGATGLDGIVLCVAANEGVMPQTVEHFNIARLLGVDRGFMVLTKVDLVDSQELASSREALRKFVSGSFLEDSPIIEVSALNGIGMDAVREALAEVVSTPVERDAHDRFFLPLDRVFTMRGFGAVVTGTLRGGTLHANDRIEILPEGLTATVRALQIHGQPVEQAAPGQRVAVNLRNINREQLRRGAVVASPGFLWPTRRIDAELNLLDDCPISVKNGTTVRLLIGTTEAIAKLRLLDRAELAPGDSAIAQLRLDRDIATHQSERFLIRSYSPMRTIGGGRILDVNPERHRRFDIAIKERLETTASGDTALILEQRIEAAGPRGVHLDALAEELGVAAESLQDMAAQLKGLPVANQHIVGASAYRELLEEVVVLLEEFHHKNPNKNGLNAGSLPKLLAVPADDAVLRLAVDALAAQKRIRLAHDVLSLEGFDPFAALNDRERQLIAELEEAFLSSGFETPLPQSVLGSDNARLAAFDLLIETGRLVRLKTYDRKSQIVLHAETLERAQRAIANEFPYPEPFALKDVRDLLGSTRKYIVPLMEHFDAAGITVRSGDARRLRQ